MKLEGVWVVLQGIRYLFLFGGFAITLLSAVMFLRLIVLWIISFARNKDRDAAMHEFNRRISGTWYR